MKLYKKLFFILLAFTPTLASADWKSEFTALLKNGGAYVRESNGKDLFSHRADEGFMPASTLKIATAACAISELGADFRFKTEFYLDSDNTLYIKGYGDPSLISEEIGPMAAELREKGLKKVNGIVLDASFFSKNIIIDGSSATNNPYDAMNAALLVNYNTIYVQKLGNGQVISAEPQTPITPLAIARGKKMGVGKNRINLQKDLNSTLTYAGELIGEFLKQEGVKVGGTITPGSVASGSRLIYTHYSKTLEEILPGMLEYSTNVTTNQLFLTMGAEKMGGPATVEKGQQVLNGFLKQKLGWKNPNMMEGSGLSRKNRVTAREMMKLLDYFKPYKNLLPLKENKFRAKTGTLTGVNTFAGYMTLSNGKEVQFVLLVNSPVGFNYKFQLANKLYGYLNK